MTYTAKKVVWREGMLLEPQHFQQAERFQAHIVGQQVRTAQPYCWGISRIDIDREALTAGQFVLNRVEGVFADGTTFSCPGRDGAVPARSVDNALAPECEHTGVFLAVPLLSPHRANLHAPQTTVSEGCRFRAVPSPVPDESLGLGDKEIELCEMNLSVRLGGESVDGCASLPIARLCRAADGALELDDRFVPPLLAIGASPAVLRRLRSLLDLLQARADALAQGRKPLANGYADFADGHATARSLLYTYNQYLPSLLQLLHDPCQHPASLYSILASLRGALCTFADGASAGDIPRYTHQEGGAACLDLMASIAVMVGGDFDAPCVRTALRSVSPAVYAGEFGDAAPLKASRVYLVVSAECASRDLALAVLQRAKLCAHPALESLVSSAMPGLQIRHVQRAPEDLPLSDGEACFAVVRSGPLWEGVLSSRSLALYLPGELPGVQAALVSLSGMAGETTDMEVHA